MAYCYHSLSLQLEISLTNYKTVQKSHIKSKKNVNVVTSSLLVMVYILNQVKVFCLRERQ